MKSSGRAAFTLTLCLVFFGSGVAALVLQTLWLQAAGLFLGHGVWASSLVLSAFMGGLAIGGLIAQRVGRPMSIESHLRWGMQLAERGELERASAHTREVLRLFPDSGSAQQLEKSIAAARARRRAEELAP